VNLYYALTKKRLYLSLVEPVLHGLIDADLDGKPMATAVEGTGAALRTRRGRDGDSMPTAAKPSIASTSGGGQLVLDLQVRSPSAILQAISWAVEKELRSRVRSDELDAEVYLRGLPGRSEAEQQRVLRNYEGSRILTPEGVPFKITVEGVEDPARGTLFHPKFPDVPPPGSELGLVLGVLGNSHAALAFDIEPGSPDEPSLRAEFTVSREVHAE
jgi:hypothetical protein